MKKQMNVVTHVAKSKISSGLVHFCKNIIKSLFSLRYSIGLYSLLYYDIQFQIDHNHDNESINTLFLF